MPALQPGRVLVRSFYSLISAGTELAALSPPSDGPSSETDLAARSTAALRLLSKALRDPQKAKRRVVAMARGQVARALPPRARAAAPAVTIGALTWAQSSGALLETSPGGSFHLTRYAVPNAYQALASPVEVPEGHAPAVKAPGRSGTACSVLVGFLDRDNAHWVGHVAIGPGVVDDLFIFPPGEPSVTLVLANGEEPKPAPVRLDEISVELLPPGPSGEPASDMSHQGWNVGYRGRRGGGRRRGH